VLCGRSDSSKIEHTRAREKVGKRGKGKKIHPVLEEILQNESVREDSEGEGKEKSLFIPEKGRRARTLGRTGFTEKG